jgi:hypothetical protein
MSTPSAISMQNGKLNVPDHPIIPFIEGDGTGPDIWRASVRVMDAAVAKAYGGKRKITGTRPSPAKRPSTRPATGSPIRPSRTSRSTSSASRAR